MAVLLSAHGHWYMSLSIILLVLPWLLLSPSMCTPSMWMLNTAKGQRLSHSAIQILEKEMLRRLGLDRRPEGFHNVSEYMLDVFDQLSQDPDAEVIWPIGGRERNLGPVNMVISHPLYDSTRYKVGQHYLTYSTNSVRNSRSPQVDKNVELLAAEMRVHRRGLTQPEWRRLATVWQVPHLIDIHEVVRPHPSNPITRLVDSRVVSLLRGGWMSFDMSSIGRDWLSKQRAASHQSKAHFLINLKTLDGQPSPVRHLKIPHDAHHRTRRDASRRVTPELKRALLLRRTTMPQYLTFYRSKRNEAAGSEDQPPRRKIRHKESKQRKKKYRRQSSQSVYASSYHVISPDVNQVCQLRPMYVDFDEIGWSSWIVAPIGYNAGLCSGSCPNPLSNYFNASNHAIVQMIVNAVNVMMVPPPTCVPIRLTRLSLLHLGSNREVIYKTYDDMRATSCGCR